MSNSDFQLTADMRDKVALVVGGAGGIGGAICRALAAGGMRVVVGYRRRANAATELVTTLPGDEHRHIAIDVEDSANLQDLREDLRQHEGRLDVLVNCAGTTRFVAHDDLESLDDNLIDEIFRVNWRGTFAAIRALKPLIAETGGGTIINISSIAGTTGMGSNVAYCASKAAVNTMTISLARALAPDIRVVAIAPGLVDTEFVQGLDPEWRNAQERLTPLGKLASPEDVARVAYAAVAQMKSSTGCVLPVDGGRPLS